MSPFSLYVCCFFLLKIKHYTFIESTCTMYDIHVHVYYNVYYTCIVYRFRLTCIYKHLILSKSRVYSCNVSLPLHLWPSVTIQCYWLRSTWTMGTCSVCWRTLGPVCRWSINSTLPSKWQMEWDTWPTSCESCADHVTDMRWVMWLSCDHTQELRPQRPGCQEYPSQSRWIRVHAGKNRWFWPLEVRTEGS